MTLNQELRKHHHDLWERMATHPFVQEMAADTLPLDKFQRYFLQDYLFLRNFTTLLALGVAKAPRVDAARRLAKFLAAILQGEEELFRGSFRDWGLAAEDYSRAEITPTATAFGDLMTRVAYEGSFPEILTVLVVTEWAYLDWATRLIEAESLPSTPVYRAWTEIHSNDDFRDFVHWLILSLDECQPTDEQRQRIEELFHTTLRYELAFWEMGYRGEEWPA